MPTLYPADFPSIEVTRLTQAIINGQLVTTKERSTKDAWTILGFVSLQVFSDPDKPVPTPVKYRQLTNEELDSLDRLAGAHGTVASANLDPSQIAELITLIMNLIAWIRKFQNPTG